VIQLVDSALTGVLFLLCITASFAQQPPAQPGGWHGLLLGVSTPEDAIRILGQPSGDKSLQSLRLTLVDKWLAGGKYNQKIFRQLRFKKPPGFEEAGLSFLDNKLVLIRLSARTGDIPDWIDPDNLSTTFNTKFIYSEWHFGKKLPPLSEFEKLDSTPPKKFAELYNMIAIIDQSFIVAGVDNIKARGLSLFGPPCTGCAKRENKNRSQRDAGGSFPGQVTFIEIVSRKLGNDQTVTSSQ
jgi:hypothetical protein